jgi:uncharacterized membrane protein
MQASIFVIFTGIRSQKIKTKMRHIFWGFVMMSCCILCLHHIAFAQDPRSHNETRDTALDTQATDNGGEWKWGMFYYNKNDHRLFPPKANGMGWTVNFANPWSVATMILIIAPIIIVLGYARRKKTKAS